MNRLFEWIKFQLLKYLGKIHTLIIDRADVAIKITDIIKKVLFNPELNILVELTPSKTDDVIFAKGKLLSINVLQKLAIALKVVSITDTPEEAAIKLMEWVRGFDKGGQDMFIRELSAMILDAIHPDSPNGKKLSMGELAAIVQLKYHKILNK